MTGPPAPVECPDCAGTTFLLVDCRCTRGGNRLLVDTTNPTTHEAYVDCLLCHGIGTVAVPCHDCRQLGIRRPQVVLTVVNLDTGAVASASVVPGSIEPGFDRDGHPALDLAPLVLDLAAHVGVASVHDLTTPDRPFEELTVLLPNAWRPDLPAEQRHSLEATALARHSGDPWLVHLGRSTPAPPPPTVQERLANLATFASQLCLDLVIEARRQRSGDLTWTIRYDAPAAPVPAEQHRRFDSLTAALDSTAVADALHGLHERALTAPAYLVVPNGPPQPPTTLDLDVDRLEQRIRTDSVDVCTGNPLLGAQAIWRDGRWWHTGLRQAGSWETYTASDTGQIVRRRHMRAERVCEPPDPSWQGAAIPSLDCTECTGSQSPLPGCRTCRGSRRLYLGAVVTITDLDNRVLHLNWLADPERPVPAPPVALQPDGTPVVALPSHYRLAHWANILGVRPEHLTELDTGVPVDLGSRDGLIPLLHPDDDPLTRHIATLTAGRPAARLLVRTSLPAAPPLPELIRLVHGLHLALAVTVEMNQPQPDTSLREYAEAWQVDVLRPDQVEHFTPQRPFHPSVESAVATCWAYLGMSICAAVPTDPRRAIPEPQSPALAAGTGDDPEESIRQLGRRHPGQPVAALLTPTGCHIHLWLPDGSGT
ncbi:hypothetical protein [Micromonospora sp. NBC_01796]|uniref:hypothetical protein n=1 Tax=Micromonospora sp. NBC_01796 TaxID=2975987 RepID=UPI002DDAB759|nr:hypothetical protein [Micromonospora sp. NBC_01796]WSA88314.1 hypothetical protein OIE47_12250 [Micromonospora sp. NBC_01796]